MQDVFVRDLDSDTTTLVSVNLSGNTGDWLHNNRSEYPFMSADGRFVVFTSFLPDLVSNDTNGGIRDVFVRDLLNQQTSLVSVNATGGSGNSFSFTQAITPDGRFVAFYTHATDLAGISDTNAARDVFVRDLQNGTTAAASVSQAGTSTGNGDSLLGGISADGRYVAFVSDAADLAANDSNGARDVFLRDLQAGTTTLASVNATGGDSGNNLSYAPFISQDGSLVAFTSGAADLTSLPDTNNQADVFIRPVVPTPQQAIADLIALLRRFALPPGIENSLSVKLEHALASVDAGNPSAACGQIGAFINSVEAEADKNLTADQASQLLAGANRIQAALGCQ
jgi:Tol biopolymer transport system component